MRYLRGFGKTPWYLTLVFAVVTTTLIISRNDLGCTKTAAAAFGLQPSDYCYVTPITATYTGGGTLTNTAFRVAFNALGITGADHMDDDGWDIHPATSGFLETDLLAGDMASSTASWWVHVPSITSGNNTTINLYYGESDIGRDQGLLFTGSDSATTTHHGDFNIADNLTLTVRLEMLSSSAQTATLASHWDNDAGYRISASSSAGALVIRGQVDSVSCAVAWPTAGTNANVWVDLTFVSPTTTITISDVNAASLATNTCGGGPASITSTSTPFVMGTSLANGIIRDVKVLSASTTMAHYGFSPGALTEIEVANPLYVGTVLDESGRGRHARYYLNRDQSGWSASIGAEALVSAGSLSAFPSNDVNLLGSNQFGIGIGLTPTPESTGDMFHTLFGASVVAFDDAGGPRTLAWALTFVTLSLGFMLITFLLIRYMPAAILMGGVPLVYGVVKGYLPGWVLFLWGLFAISAWFAVRRGESPQ